jgi:hypothetical protein
MPTTVVLTDIVFDAAPSTVVRVRWSDGSELEFNHIDNVRQWYSQPEEDIDLTRKLCVAYAAARSFDFANLATVKDKPFTIDMSANNPIKVN